MIVEQNDFLDEYEDSIDYDIISEIEPSVYIYHHKYNFKYKCNCCGGKIGDDIYQCTNCGSYDIVDINFKYKRKKIGIT